ncbi:MAG: hypothetical protein J6C46_02570 [Clostridia bacterium]|nr:hypothetical protein [Clostridia bacterium]
MYLHIGNNDMVLIRNVIGVFDIEKIKDSKYNKKFIENISEKDLKENKTIVLTQENGLLKKYLTNISVMTINKRIDKIFI